MNKSESKYFNTANRIDQAFLELLGKKDFEYITVKEICQKAGVNRSTFYLHYETINDLLIECNEFVINKFINSCGHEPFTKTDLKILPVSELNFVTPEYLVPWLEFIKSNKQLFRTYLNKFSALTIEKNNKLLYNNVFSPILERYRVCENKKPYMMQFYIEGIMAVVKLWVTNDCKDSLQDICNIIITCVNNEKD